MAHVTHDQLVHKIGTVGQAHRNLRHHMHTLAGIVPPAVPPVASPAAPAPSPKGR